MEITTQPRNTLVISLGETGQTVADAFQVAIERRHPGVALSSVQFLHIARSSEAAHVAHDSNRRWITLELDRNQDLSAQAKALYPSFEWSSTADGIIRQLAHFPRWAGQIALGQNMNQLQAEIEAAFIALLGEKREIAPSLDAPAQKRMHATDDPVDVFILLSLADLFMTGLLPDLPFVLRHFLSLISPKTQQVNIHLVLVLPEIGLDEADGVSAQDGIRVGYREACNFACLAELDHFMAWPGMPTRFHRSYLSGVTIDRIGSPLGPGRIFLIENANEGGCAISEQTQLREMIGSWLYAVTFTPVRSILDTRTAQSQTAYSSFGHGGFEVPFELWVERVSNRLQVDLVNAMLPVEIDQADADVELVAEMLGLTEERLLPLLLTTTRYREISLDAAPLTGSYTLSQPQDLLEAVQRAYSEQLKGNILQLRGELNERRRELLRPDSTLAGEETLPKQIVAYILELANETNGLEQAQRTLQALHDNVTQYQQAARDRFEALEQAAYGSGIFKRRLPGMTEDLPPLLGEQETIQFARRVERTPESLSQWVNEARRSDEAATLLRQEFYGYSQVAGTIPRPPFALPVLLSLFVIPVAGVFLWQVLRTVQAPPAELLAGLIASSAILLLGTLIFAVLQTSRPLRLLRLDVIRAYDTRLKAFRDLTLYRAIIELYDDLFAWFGTLRVQIDELTSLLVTGIRQPLLEKWRSLRDEERLCERYTHGFVQSVLTKELLYRCETQAQLRHKGRNVSFLKSSVGTPKDWYQEMRSGSIQGEHLVYRLRTAIETLSRDQSYARLQRYTLAHFIIHMDEPRLRAYLFDHQLRYCFPYIRFDADVIPQHLQVSPYYWIAGQKTEDFDPQALIQDKSFELIDIGSPYTLYFTTMRHEFPLLAARTITHRYGQQYLNLSVTERASAHSRPEYVICQDASRIDTTVDWANIPPFVLCVLACAYGTVTKNVVDLLLDVTRAEFEEGFRRIPWEERFKKTLADEVIPLWAKDDRATRRSRVESWLSSIKEPTSSESFAGEQGVIWLERVGWEMLA